jgi:hypothetical protein
MAINIFEKVSRRFEGSLVSIPITIACAIGIMIALVATYSDYMSSYWGYLRLPTQKVGEAAAIIALLPQVGQIIFGALSVLNFEKTAQGVKINWLYFMITFFLFLWDNGTDVWYKTFQGTAPAFVWFIAIVESIAVYTVGSEVLLIASFGLFLYMLPLCLKQVGLLFAKLAGEDMESGGGMPYIGSTPPGQRAMPGQGTSPKQSRRR